MTTVQEQAVQSSELLMRMLVTIHAPGQPEPFRFVANDTDDVTMPDGTKFLAAEITRGEIKTSTEGDKEQMSLKMSNRWLEWSNFISYHGKQLQGARCVIEDVFLDHLDEGAVWRYDGEIDRLKATISEFSCVVTRDIVDYAQDAPAMDYGPTCQFTFGDSRCRCTNAAGPCDQTITTCEKLGNIERYQGHPSIPREMVLRVS